MIYVGLYNALLAPACIYAAWKGGQPERLAFFGWALACLCTFLIPYQPNRSWLAVETTGLLIDSAVLVWFVAIAAFANRFWPIWVAAILLLTVAIHGVKGYDPSLLPYLYAVAIGKLGYPVLGMLVLGVARHQQRLRALGHDRDWSFRLRGAA